jgi:hypothetical protein
MKTLTDFNIGAMTTARRWLTLATVVVVRWFKDLNIIYIVFECFVDHSCKKEIKIFLCVP